MYRYERMIFDARHVARLTLSLHSILGRELATPISLKVCCGAIAAGHTLRLLKRGESANVIDGLPWSTKAALDFLAGRGFVFDPRIAFEALSRVEARHIIDRRRVAYRHPRWRGASAASRCSQASSALQNRRHVDQR